MNSTWILGNWKMNGSPEMVSTFAREMAIHLANSAAPLPSRVELGVCPTFLHLMHAKQHLPKGLWLGAQDAHLETHGAHSGDVSAAMLQQAGAVFCLVGHSERRQGHAEDAQLVRRKLEAVLNAGLSPVLCLGETLAERESKQHQAVVAQQVTSALQGIAWPSPSAQGTALPRLFVAYEPIWAIGTGLSANPQQVDDMHQWLRQTLVTTLGADQANALPLLYGGSVNAKNAQDLLALPEVNGALVGGASLQAGSFWEIARLAPPA